MTWQEALDFAWKRVEETGWRWRVYHYRDGRDGDIRWTAVRAGRRKVRT